MTPLDSLHSLHHAYAVDEADEADFRYRARRYRTVLRESRIVYAGKAFLTVDPPPKRRSSACSTSRCFNSPACTSTSARR